MKLIDPAKPKRSRSTALALGAGALFVSSLFSQMLGLMTLVVTARLLTPADFGVIAYFMIIVALLEILQRSVMVILIRQDEISDDLLNTVFTIQILLGVISAGLIWLSSQLIELLNVPELVELIPSLCLLALMSSLRSPRFPLLERNFRFGFAAGEETISRVTYTLFAILLAWFWRDFWAIVVAVVLTQLARVIWSFSVAPMLPRLTLRCWRDCFGFSMWSVGVQIIQFLTTNMPQIVIGATLGLVDAGIFRIGYRFVLLFTVQVFAPLERVIYPGLADASRTEGTSQKTFEQANAILLGIIVPISVGMALVSKYMIIVVAGYQWVAAAQVIWILAPLKAVETLQANVKSASYVEGNTRLLFLRNGMLLIITIVFMLFGTRFGFTGALIGAGASSLAAIFITLIMARNFGVGGFFKPVLAAWRSFVATGVMTVAVLILISAYGNEDVAGWAYSSVDDLPLLRIRFSAQVLTGIVTYIGTHLLLWHMVGRPRGFESMALDLLSKIKNHFIGSPENRKPGTGT
ncbi:oligosaccharide flippase family protein [Ruegeria arenilitoris]|uniref:oligosaccharide flippase family protein n=1 Tax=Ruegeria arenilitoris TaxID=1173585 RepID=UPI003C7A825D